MAPNTALAVVPVLLVVVGAEGFLAADPASLCLPLDRPVSPAEAVVLTAAAIAAALEDAVAVASFAPRFVKSSRDHF